MQLEHSFTVPVGINDAWVVLTDLPRVVTCMPGAAIDEVVGDEYHGTVKVKLGAISLAFKGIAKFADKDDAAHRATIDARGKDARGGGAVTAKIGATLSPEGTGTKVVVATDLDITGRAAQFGRGVMVDVGNKIIGQFADRLATQLQEASPAPTKAGEAAVEPETAGVSATAVEPETPEAPAFATTSHAGDDAPDLLSLAGPALLKRLAKPAAIASGVLLLILLIRKLRRR
jgi:carbon monoxide dehydrogenase subunit G